MLKRFDPPIKTTAFSVVRKKIEKMIEEGFSFKVTKESKEKKENIRPPLSPLEMQW